MIKFDSRYFGNAHRISDYALASTVATLYDGQWLMLNSDGAWEIHDGTSGIPGFITTSSKYGTISDNIGRAITEDPAGRDNVTSTGKAVVLVGPFRLATDQYETDSYAINTPLKISANGKLTPATLAGGVDPAYDIVAYVAVAPAQAGDPMTIISK